MFARSLLVVAVIFMNFGPIKVASRTCQAGDFTYDYTECDSKGQRWRVAVPKNSSDGKCDGVPFPVRGKNCSFTCTGGKYLDLQTDDCLNCPAGTYSLGGGQRFEDLDGDRLPEGFEIRNVRSRDLLGSSEGTDGTEGSKECPEKGGWQVSDGWLLYVPTPCWSILSYSARLIRPGYLKYVYRLPKTPDDSLYFSVNVQNEQCESYRDRLKNRILGINNEESEGHKKRNRGSWQMEQIDLKTGQNVISFHASNAVFGGALRLLKKGSEKSEAETDNLNSLPLVISRIDILGLAYTQKCTKCPRGTYSSGGTTSCTPCKANTKSSRGAEKCNDCPSGQYSAARSSACFPRPPCKSEDYYGSHSSCDENQKTQITYKWVQPKICLEDLAESVKLPTDKVTKTCPKCNPGMDPKKSCNFCPENHFSDGNSDCENCPPDTMPVRGYFYTWWNKLPVNMNTDCEIYEDDNTECNAQDMDTWITDGEKIHTAHSRRPGVVLELNLDVPGFKNPLMTGEPSLQNPIGHLTFIFSTKCVSSECAFYFAEQVDESETKVIGVWNGTETKKPYKHPIIHSSKTRYIWAFVRTGITKSNPDSSYMDEEASLYTINVTHTSDGGASNCASCPIQNTLKPGTKSGCVPCPAGHYMEEESHMCMQCPPDTMVNNTGSPVGKKSCQACGPNLHSDDGVVCRTNGELEFTLEKVKDETGNATVRNYDMRKLIGKQFQIDGVKVFGLSGSGYYHTFNLTLSGGNEKVFCHHTKSEFMSDHESDIEAMICRSTVVPLKSFGSNNESVTGIAHISTLSLGSRIIGVTNENEFDGIKLTPKELDIETGDPKETLDVHFFYRNDAGPSRHCPNGQAAVVTARCEPITNRTTVRLPRACPDGTCDGCVYHIIISSPNACPLCGKSDYTEIRGECIKGYQTIHLIPAKHCVLSGVKSKESSVACIVFGVEVQFLVGLASACSLLLCCFVICVWKKNRKLEYKYMKLIEARSGQDGNELPAAESCALEEDEDEDQESTSADRVIFARGGKKTPEKSGGGGIFGRKKATQANELSDRDLRMETNEKSAFMFETDD